ncbi:hypothetical protein TIFTF001_044474 [Ficus carica]|uniref:Uncharacterized protein n=1 Tax=Ficus carica TaxID=3494 RepID=A0AA87Z7N7_FICCA|nr:hypothetical protein TIFTF001_044461 [Ficus carica]GMN30397.1 hypothetical protein TIFTF001_044474 [Ficus carica]
MVVTSRVYWRNLPANVLGLKRSRSWHLRPRPFPSLVGSDRIDFSPASFREVGVALGLLLLAL